jgi:hypothetical protein
MTLVPTKAYQTRHTRSVSEAALEANFASVKGTVGCDQVAELETDLRQSGRLLRGRCPLPDHEDRTPSFFCYPNHSRFYDGWWCYGCNRGGDVVDLYAAMEGPFGSMVMALHALAERFGLKLWRDEDFMSDFQLAAVRAERKIEAALDRALSQWYLEREVMPVADAIADEAERELFLNRAFKEAGLIRPQAPSRISKSKARRVQRSAV